MPADDAAQGSSTSLAGSKIRLPDVTIVFCAVEGGKTYSVRSSRRDFRAVHVKLVALIRSVLRQVRSRALLNGSSGGLRLSSYDLLWAHHL